MSRSKQFLSIYKIFLNSYGHQHWWPGESPIEVMIGAILTQNTAWLNVERAINHLRDAHALDAAVILATPVEQLAQWLRPSGYFNVKAKRLRAFCQWYLEQGGYAHLAQQPTLELRRALLSVNGIGPETADDILLYAFERPVFVVDAYTRRLFTRLGLLDGAESYEEVRALFEAQLPGEVELFNDYHAQIVHHAKYVCKVKPLCAQCVVASHCVVGQQASRASLR